MPALLLIDDDTPAREALSELLTCEGYVVESAPDGTAALSKLRAGFRPRLIILDLAMPDMNGFEFRAAQRADRYFGSIPVVVYSGASHLRDYAEQLDAVGFLRKPIEPENLLALLRTHCAQATD